MKSQSNSYQILSIFLNAHFGAKNTGLEIKQKFRERHIRMKPDCVVTFVEDDQFDVPQLILDKLLTSVRNILFFVVDLGGGD